MENYKSISSILRTLDEIKHGNQLNISMLNEACALVEGHPNGAKAIEPLFMIMEKFRSEDFGSPGEIVHTLETFFRHGYEELLVKSITRQPTLHTIWMLNRLVNGTMGAERENLLRLLRDVSNSSNIDPSIRNLAKEFLTVQS